MRAGSPKSSSSSSSGKSSMRQTPCTGLAVDAVLLSLCFCFVALGASCFDLSKYWLEDSRLQAIGQDHWPSTYTLLWKKYNCLAAHQAHTVLKYTSRQCARLQQCIKLLDVPKHPVWFCCSGWKAVMAVLLIGSCNPLGHDIHLNERSRSAPKVAKVARGIMSMWHLSSELRPCHDHAHVVCVIRANEHLVCWRYRSLACSST